ncbi:hypothetical protein Trydic_g20406 [Trypoxylus dichotomus]
MGNWFGSPQDTTPPPRISQNNYQDAHYLSAHFDTLTIEDSRRKQFLLQPAIRSDYSNNNWNSYSQYTEAPRTYVPAPAAASPVAAPPAVASPATPRVQNVTTSSRDRSQLQHQAAPRIRYVKPNPLRDVTYLSPTSISFTLNAIQEYTYAYNWDDVSYNNQLVHLISLNPNDTEYEHVEELFRDTNKRCFVVTDIERIQNPYLFMAFILKKEEMTRRIGHVEIEELFHGTKASCVTNICHDNFDWRRYGENVGNKFGQGISFTPISNYATHYADDVMNGRIMLLAYVLIGEEIVGTKNMVLPPAGKDTSIKPDRHVIVKYEDNEFYPAYKITYKCTNKQELQQRKVKNTGSRRKQNKQATLQATTLQAAPVYYYDDYYD